MPPQPPWLMPEQPSRKVIRCVHDHVQEIVHARQAHERHSAAELKEEPHDERHECVVGVVHA